MNITKDSKITYDPVSIMVDGRRWFPMMGEMHFSRYPNKYWEQELTKMKAGGIDIVSLYVIWIHHEEVKGEYDFSGDRDLKKFLDTIKKVGLYSILRIGPWASPTGSFRMPGTRGTSQEVTHPPTSSTLRPSMKRYMNRQKDLF